MASSSPFRLDKISGRSLVARTIQSHELKAMKGNVVVSKSILQSSSSALPPLSLGVCSWSLQVKNIPELKGFLDRLRINVVQIACGDPHHASWDEGDGMPAAALASGIVMAGAMLGFPGEDYTTPQTIKETGGFGNPALRSERIERLKWGLRRTHAARA